MSHCRLCNGTHLNHLYTVKAFPIVRCQDCGFAQVNRKPDSRELQAIYNESYFGHNKYRDTKTLSVENNRRLRLMQTYVQPDSIVLEAGCGAGFFLETASDVYAMYGFDLAESAVNQAKIRNAAIAKYIVQATLEQPPDFVDHQIFDAICLWDAIEHVWDPREVLEGLFKRLKPGGYLFFSTPDIGALTARILGKRWAFMTPPEHLSFLSEQSVHYLVETALGHNIRYRASLGKKVNLGFLIYKLHRVAPAIVPRGLLKILERPGLTDISIYVPTADIQYLAIQKSEG